MTVPTRRPLETADLICLVLAAIVTPVPQVERPDWPELPTTLHACGTHLHLDPDCVSWSKKVTADRVWRYADTTPCVTCTMPYLDELTRHPAYLALEEAAAVLADLLRTFAEANWWADIHHDKDVAVALRQTLSTDAAAASAARAQVTEDLLDPQRRNFLTLIPHLGAAAAPPNAPATRSTSTPTSCRRP